jgi:predicted secreted acid phosphatase
MSAARRLATAAILAAAAALAPAAPAALAREAPTPVQTVRPTGVGLPQLGQTQTMGAAELVPALRAYHDSGAYERDLATVDRLARSYLERRLKARHRPRRPALVLDIDETSLSNYAGLTASGFTASGTTVDVVSGTGTAIAPTLQLFDAARRRHVAVFFITGRPGVLRSISETNLRSAGYKGWAGISFSSGGSTIAYKSRERARIERRGYTILANVGDQESDLAGGHAARAFKLPNPFYLIP